jgi:hypothetical protein
MATETTGGKKGKKASDAPAKARPKPRLVVKGITLVDNDLESEISKLKGKFATHIFTC